MNDNSLNMRILKIILRISALIEIFYFTASHWFFHEYFFNSLGIYGNDLSSTFVISQFQLIGAQVLGIAMITWIAASDPIKYRSIIQVLLFTGSVAVVIFVYNILAARVPVQFIANAILIGSQIIIITALYPWKREITT
ncbi:MAG: BphX family protein [Gallionellaceae bacterium]|jgi:hypothetical protein